MNVSAAYSNFDNQNKESYPLIGNLPISPPDLVHDSEEDDEDSLCTPSLSLSPKQGYKDQDLLNNHNINDSQLIPGRRKSVPHRSPAATQDTTQTSLFDRDIVFQVDVTIKEPLSDDLKCTSKIICGQSLLTTLRKRLVHARRSHQSTKEPVFPVSRRKRARTASIIQIPRSQHHRTSFSSGDSECAPSVFVPKALEWIDHCPYQPTEFYKKGNGNLITKFRKSPMTRIRRPSSNNGSSFGRPSRVKGPCQACQEPSDGCMRKAFNWPFPTDQTFNDKGKAFVYLCNKCGLRYNKSGGCVCRNCKWVFCKEEKKKALLYIDAMRRKHPDGYVDLNADIENFVCSPKYWACGRPWKVGWVLNNLDGDEDDSLIPSFNHTL